MSHVLKLTAYLTERERTNGRLLADELLDLIARHRVSTSIVLRGIASFGPRDIVRTDESLSLSEDLPITIAAIDRAAVITPLTDSATRLVNRGLLTLERARIVDGSFPEIDDDVRFSLYLGRRHRSNGVPAYIAACDVFHRLGFAGAISYLGVDGTVAGQRCRARFFSGNADVPMMLLGVGSAGQAMTAAAELTSLLPEPVMSVERIRVCKLSGRLIAEPPTAPTQDTAGPKLAQKLMVVTDEDAHHGGLPIHRALVRRLRESRHAAGATVLRGLWGFTDGGRPHGDRMLRLRRSVPVATVIVDTPAAIRASFDIVDELTAEHGLVTCETVPAALALDGPAGRGGTRLADPFADGT